ncbi:peptide chain release factor PrfB3 chloroplastic isoform X2 [Prunus yedoensis var. nudiflora]|uniref:Peptide chain release factor PrfB3 chloroplastic isoform X2 n=1 Tax=Prunus yedoensis var. nudiflora TaxID=2094558 RepID=A0A314YU19_PRUYE|nr:peptide chain release factor PrfB3 chloroplastic isoform X2 [Prunus yedoensis var. nudiflora]
MSILQASSASVDVFPLFLGKAHDLQIDEEDLVVPLPSMLEEEQGQTGPSGLIFIQDNKVTWFGVL